MKDVTSPLIGCWLLRTLQVEEVETGKRADMFPTAPQGALILTSTGRMMAVITPSERPPLTSDADRSTAFQQLVAYSGRYRLEPPNRFVTSVGVAWLPGWLGTEQVRNYRMEDDRLDIITDPMRNPHGTDAMVRGVLSWVRET